MKTTIDADFIPASRAHLPPRRAPESDLATQARNWVCCLRNSERRAHWRHRALVTMGHWPNGDVAAWRRACRVVRVDRTEGPDNGLGFWYGLELAMGVGTLIYVGAYVLWGLLALADA